MKEKTLLLIGVLVIVGFVSLLVVSTNREVSEESNNQVATSSSDTTNPLSPTDPNPTVPTNPNSPVKPGGVGSVCQPTGCSGQVCSDRDIITTCEFREEYACYSKARCERQASGECGWTETESFRQCLANIRPAY